MPRSGESGSREPADLLDILTRLRLQPADTTSADAAVRGYLDLLMARIAALTAALRSGSVEPVQEALAARLLLADVTAVVAQLRGHANELALSLSAALHATRAALDDASGVRAADGDDTRSAS
jgi:hypothetical protein